jgi:hypothetical protein
VGDVGRRWALVEDGVRRVLLAAVGLAEALAAVVATRERGGIVPVFGGAIIGKGRLPSFTYWLIVPFAATVSA